MGIFEKMSGYNEKDLYSGLGFKQCVEGYLSAFVGAVKKLDSEDKKVLCDFVNDVFGDVIKELKK